MTDCMTKERETEIRETPKELLYDSFNPSNIQAVIHFVRLLRDVCVEILAELDALRARIEKTINAFCSCGGAGPGEGCVACDIYHAVTIKR